MIISPPFLVRLPAAKELIHKQDPMALPIQLRDRASDIYPWDTGTQKLRPALIHRYNTASQPPWSLYNVTLRVLSRRWGSIAFNQVSYIFSSHY